MLHRRHQLAVRHLVAGQLVGDDHPGHLPQALSSRRRNFWPPRFSRDWTRMSSTLLWRSATELCDPHSGHDSDPAAGSAGRTYYDMKIAEGRPPTPKSGADRPAHPLVRFAAAQDDPSCHRLNRGAALTLAMRSTVRTPRRHRFDVVEGSVRIYLQFMFGGPGRGLPGAATMTRYWSLSSAWHRHGWWACGVGGAGRDLRHVGAVAVIGVGARAAGRALMLRAASSSVANWRSARTRPVAAGGRDADGRGCRDGLR